MANIYKDSDRRKKVVPGGIQEPPVTEEREEETQVVIEQKDPLPAAQAPTDILAGLKAEKEAAKSYAFYLSDKNVKKLRALAKKEGVSASKLLDHILSEVLI